MEVYFIVRESVNSCSVGPD